MNTKSFLLAFAVLVAASSTGCSSVLDDIDESIECLDTAGYESGVVADDGNGSLRGTHQMVKPSTLAEGAEEGLMIEVPLASLEDESASLDIEAAGQIELLAEPEAACSDDDNTYVKVRVRGGPGGGRLLVREAGRTITSFEVGVARPASIEIFPLDAPFVVGQPARVCAVARDEAGTALYADDSLSMSADGAVSLSVLDPGQACRDVTPSAEGKFTITVEGLEVTGTVELEAVNAPESGAE
ncbi:MAG: hypothetical protein HOW73_39750 [Polyangiaceae bacterium]|nr:hypothetical protein [Polyangiaceae bacterium]